jgi:hypothetical protein
VGGPWRRGRGHIGEPQCGDPLGDAPLGPPGFGLSAHQLPREGKALLRRRFGENLVNIGWGEHPRDSFPIGVLERGDHPDQSYADGRVRRVAEPL